MRTLLDAVLPPPGTDRPMFSPSTPALRTFSQPAVLTNADDLVEVGLDGTVMTAPSAGAEQAKPALERGVAILESPGAGFNAAEKFTPSL